MTEKEYPEVDFKNFLESTPPYTWVSCPDFFKQNTKKSDFLLNSGVSPMLNCNGEHCQGERLFRCEAGYNGIYLDTQRPSEIFVTYSCRNCNKNPNLFALAYMVNGSHFKVQKLGQTPLFGKKLPNQVNKLIKGERELFLKGMRCENQGMGIGAFSYYRRVLDSQKNRIFDEIIKVINATSSDKSIVAELEAAKAEPQFTKAVDTIKHAFPDGLLISGHNPLKLLYQAVSQGLHNHSDEVCLEMAQSIKLVLFEFTKRLSEALSENKELNSAIGHLMKIKQNQ
jgi:hypothetical protein